MVDQLISFETAKLAKEKGCISRSPYYQIDDADEIDLVDMKGFPLHSNNEGGDYYEAPTQSLLRKWLREKHGIAICISMTSEKEDTPLFYTSHTYPIRLRLTVHNIHTDQVQWTFHDNTYEEALEKGLVNGLNLIP